MDMTTRSITEYKRLVEEQETTISLQRAEIMRLQSKLRAKRTRSLLRHQAKVATPQKGD
jgi:hypothetical protein